MHRVTRITCAVLSLASMTALAAPECTKAPKEKWMSEKEMKAKLEAQGYKIKRFEVLSSCYEIYGRNKDGKKVEIYFDPVDGSIVKQRGG
ncbi:MAG: PepSY domain-containing protein [Betaproteobacteria bacterium]|nr:PepSY domain-containing protein [Betaproteobacteria bacterium]